VKRRSSESDKRTRVNEKEEVMESEKELCCASSRVEKSAKVSVAGHAD
jgi:hypothetical protein